MHYRGSLLAQALWQDDAHLKAVVVESSQLQAEAAKHAAQSLTAYGKQATGAYKCAAHSDIASLAHSCKHD